MYLTVSVWARVRGWKDEEVGVCGAGGVDAVSWMGRLSARSFRKVGGRRRPVAFPMHSGLELSEGVPDWLLLHDGIPSLFPCLEPGTRSNGPSTATVAW